MAHTKRSPEFQREIQELIDKNLAGLWCGDKEGFGIYRIIEILQKTTTDSACMVKAADDEPVFVLRGKDPVAHDAVRFWADSAEALHLHTEKLADAILAADEMLAYAKQTVGSDG